MPIVPALANRKSKTVCPVCSRKCRAWLLKSSIACSQRPWTPWQSTRLSRTLPQPKDQLPLPPMPLVPNLMPPAPPLPLQQHQPTAQQQLTQQPGALMALPTRLRAMCRTLRAMTVARHRPMPELLVSLMPRLIARGKEQGCCQRQLQNSGFTKGH